MSFLCWLIGHKHDEDFICANDMIAFIKIKNATLRGKKIGTVDVMAKLRLCQRCLLFLHTVLHMK